MEDASPRQSKMEGNCDDRKTLVPRGGMAGSAGRRSRTGPWAVLYNLALHYF